MARMAKHSGTIGAAARSAGWAGLVGPALLLVLALFALVAGWQAALRMADLLAYPYPHDGLEGTLLYEARLLRAGEPLYQPLELYRFVSAPYPPLHYVWMALFDLWSGPHIFWGGRMVSVVAAAVIVLATVAHTWRAGGSLAAGLVAGMLLLSAPPLILWGTRIKPDVLALMFTALGLLCTSMVFGARTRRSGWLWLAAVLFAAAFFTKQTAVAGPLAAGIALWAADLRDRQTAQPHGYARVGGVALFRWRTLIFTLLYLVLALGIWAGLNLATAGQYNLHVWWSGERTEWWSFSTFRNVVGLLEFWQPMMVLAFAGVLVAIGRRELFVAAAYVLVAPITLLGAGETGAHHNHLLETHMALALAGGAALGWAGTSLLSRPVPVLVLLMSAALQLVQIGNPPAWYANQLAPNDPPERFLAFMRAMPGEILADDTGLLFQAGKPLRYNDPSTMGPAARIGKWDQRGLIDDIVNRRFSAIMIPVNVEKGITDSPNSRWTPEVLTAIRDHYRLLYRDTMYTYIPREQ